MKNKVSIILVIATCIITSSIPAYSAPDTYKLTLWNQHNGNSNDRGTKTCKIQALKDGKVVWENNQFKMLWRPAQDVKRSITIPLKAGKVDTFKITITEWIDEGGGLAEIEIYYNEKNISKECSVSVSAMWDNEHFKADKLIDGITTSKKDFEGYWILPNKQEGWVEIQLPKVEQSTSTNH